MVCVFCSTHMPTTRAKACLQPSLVLTLFIGIDNQQALPAAAADRSSAAAAAASAAAMFGKLPPQQLPQLSSIQLLHLRAQQHIAQANASPTPVSASVGGANSQAALSGPRTQTHSQPKQLPQLLAAPSPSLDLAPPSTSPMGLTPQPPGDPLPPQWGSVHSSRLVGRSRPPGHDAGFSQFVYAPAGTRPHTDEAMQALLDRLSQERTAKPALPSPTPPAAAPTPPAAAPAPLLAPQPPPPSGLASLTLMDGMAAQQCMASSLSQHQQPHR